MDPLASLVASEINFGEELFAIGEEEGGRD